MVTVRVWTPPSNYVNSLPPYLLLHVPPLAPATLSIRAHQLHHPVTERSLIIRVQSSLKTAENRSARHNFSLLLRCNCHEEREGIKWGIVEDHSWRTCSISLFLAHDTFTVASVRSCHSSQQRWMSFGRSRRSLGKLYFFAHLACMLHSLRLATRTTRMSNC